MFGAGQFMQQTLNGSDLRWLDLNGCVCVVTGAGSGIGAETAKQLSAAGAKVALLDNDPEAACSVAREIQREGGQAMGLEVNVADPAMVHGASERVASEWGACRVLVNNAATRYSGPLMEMPLERWYELMNVNLAGALNCAQIFGAEMVRAGQGGSMVHVGSITGHNPSTTSGAYSISKAGLSMLSRVLTLELGVHGIRSNVVSPGLIHTPATAGVYRIPRIQQARSRLIPAGRIGSASDIARLIVFLASTHSSYINGQDILADGGLHQALMASVARASL